MNLFRNTFLAATIGLGLSVQAHAEVLMSWDVSSLDGHETSFQDTFHSPDLISTSTFPASGLLTMTSNLTPADIDQSFGSNTWADGYTPASFIEWTVAPDTGVTFSLTSIDFTIQRGEATPPDTFDFYASINGGAFTLITDGSFQIADTGIEVTNTLNLDSSFSNLMSAVVFRLSAYNGSAGDPEDYAVLKKTGGDALVVNGAVVPEPSTYALLLVGLAGMALIVRSKKRQLKLVPVKA